ncbi:MAG TPA: hypothetical protein VGA21_00515 [Cyclobacteriaceae bacterium]|jgi:hypothetical protein
MDSHKKILGILYLVWGTLSLLIMFAMSIFFSFVMLNTTHHELGSLEIGLVKTIVTVVCGFIIIIISLPSIIGGLGMIFNQKWAFILILIAGIFSLISFPMGTAIGIYTLWVYFKDQELQRSGGQKEVFEKRNN